MRWTVGTKIGLGFAVGLLCLVAVGIVSYRSTDRLVETSRLVTHTHRVLEEIGGLQQALTDAETGQRGFIITGNEAYLEPYRAGVATVDQYVRGLRELIQDNPRQQERLNELQLLAERRLKSLADVLDEQKAKGQEGARQAVIAGAGKQKMDAIRKLLDEMRDEENGLLKDRADDVQATVHETNVTILLATVAALLVLSAAGWSISRNISKPLGKLTLNAERIAGGDLPVSVLPSSREDEVGVLEQAFDRMTRSLRGMAEVAERIAAGDLGAKVAPQSDKDMLGNAFATMVESLRRMVAQIGEGVNVLSASAGQISTSTTQLASSAAETATAVSQTTTTVEEVRQTAQLSSQKAKLVSETAQKTAQISVTGAKSTEDVIAGMNRIRQQMDAVADSMVRLSEQGQAIGQIVATVEDLAAQSNILAVNAAIEAAKAGEQGRGFAVVAQEVRSLAEQSKQATNQVRSILGDIQKATGAAVMAAEQGNKAVDAGAKQSAHAGQSIQALANGVTESAQMATQIAASSQQQLVGVDQVASAMESIKLASTQNVASAKQLESAAHSLKELGQRLKQTVEKYTV